MSHQDRREPLPKGYQFGDTKLIAATDIADATIDVSKKYQLAVLKIEHFESEALVDSIAEAFRK